MPCEIDTKTFLNLTSSDFGIREQSCLQIIAFVRDRACSGQLTWSDIEPLLKRILRGLGSPRATSRQAFFSTAVGLLCLATEGHVPFKSYTSLVEKTLNGYPASSNSEVGESYLGAILGFGALISSGYLDSQPVKNQKYVVVNILGISQNKTYLAPIGYHFICEHLAKGNAALFQQVETEIGEDLIQNRDKLTVGHLYCLLTVQDNYKSSKLLKKVLGSRQLINEKTLSIIIKALTDITSFTHSFIPEFCEHLIENPDHMKALLDHLIKIIPSSKNKKKELVALQLLNQILIQLDDETYKIIPDLLPAQLLNIVLAARSKHKKLVTQISQTLKNTLLKSPNDVKIATLEHFFETGNLMIDKLTGVNIIMSVGCSLDFNGLSKLAERYKKIILGSETSPKGVSGDGRSWTNEEKVTAAHSLARILNSAPDLSDKIYWRTENIKFIIDTAFFVNHGISSEFSSVMKTTFYSCLNHKFSKLSDYYKVMTAFVFHFDDSTKKKTLRTPMNEKVVVALSKSVNYLKSDHKDEIEELNPSKIVLFLIAYMTLWIFKHKKLATSILQDLFVAYDCLSKGIEYKEDTHWSEALIDIFLLLLSKKDSSHRYIVGCMFKEVCQYMTETGANLIFEALSPEEVAGDEGSTYDDYEDRDVGDEGEEDSESENESSDNSDDDDVEDSDEAPEVIPKFSFQSIPSDEESINIDDLDEEQAIKANEELNKILETLKSKKSLPQKTAIDFQIKVLGLIEICFEVQSPPIHFVINSIHPLLSLLNHSLKSNEKKELILKLRQVFKKLGAIRKCSVPPSFDSLKLTSMFNHVLNDPENNLSHKMYIEVSPQIGLVCKFLAKLILTHGNESSMWDSFEEHGKRFLHARPKTLILSAFTNLLLCDYTVAINMLNRLVPLVEDSYAKPYKKVILLSILGHFFKSCQNQQVSAADKELIKGIYTVIISESLKVTEGLAAPEPSLAKYDQAVFDLLCIIFKLHPTDQFDVVVTALNDKLKSIKNIRSTLKGKIRAFCQIAIPDEESFLRIGLLKKRKASVCHIQKGETAEDSEASTGDETKSEYQGRVIVDTSPLVEGNTDGGSSSDTEVSCTEEANSRTQRQANRKGKAKADVLVGDDYSQGVPECSISHHDDAVLSGIEVCSRDKPSSKTQRQIKRKFKAMEAITTNDNGSEKKAKPSDCTHIAENGTQNGKSSKSKKKFDPRKLKKEAKLRRLKSSDGMEEIRFSNVDDVELDVDSVD